MAKIIKDFKLEVNIDLLGFNNTLSIVTTSNIVQNCLMFIPYIHNKNDNRYYIES